LGRQSSSRACAFAHGGKDGTPYKVDRETYDRTIETMNAALSGAAVARSERVAALKRLSRVSPTPRAEPNRPARAGVLETTERAVLVRSPSVVNDPGGRP